MDNARYLVAANFFRGDKLIAAAVIYDKYTPEPSFTYTLSGRQRTAYLYRRGDRVPLSLYPALGEHIQGTAVSWAVVQAHESCSPEAALTLAIVRAVERWVCRQKELPSLAETAVILPTKKTLADLPLSLRQHPKVRDWRTAAARALCRYNAVRNERSQHV